jgi:hypothetical protein
MVKPINPELGARNSPEYSKKYRAKNLEKSKEYFREYSRKHFKENPDLYLYWSVKGRANRAGLPFDLEKSDIVIPETCPVLGIPLFRNTGGNKPTGNSPSVDRIIPELGYVKGNIQIISHRANVMKNDAKPEELRKFAEWVLSTFQPS